MIAHGWYRNGLIKAGFLSIPAWSHPAYGSRKFLTDEIHEVKREWTPEDERLYLEQVPGYELHVRVARGAWQYKGTGPREELTQRAAKWQEVGYKTRIVRAR